MEELEAASSAGTGASLEVLRADPGAPILKIVGEVDLASVDPLRTAIEPFISGTPDRIVFDLTELRFMDSSGLSLLLGVAEKIQVVELRGATSAVRKLIELTGLSEVLHLTG